MFSGFLDLGGVLGISGFRLVNFLGLGIAVVLGFMVWC